MSTLVAVVATLPAAVVLAHGAWWTLLALVALPRRRAPKLSQGGLRLAVLIPAHNEERMVGDTVRSLAESPYEPRPELIVVADNCSDATAAVAMAAGATVSIRDDRSLRGKSYALDFAIRQLAARAEPPNAVIVVDADSTVSPSFFSAIAGAFQGGARAVQVHYAVAPGEGHVAGLRTLAFSLVHWARPLGAGRLRLGAGLKGNGMAFRWDVVRNGFAPGLAEDAALTLELAARGVPVRFQPRATVYGYMATDHAGATIQDRRWERGRLSLARQALAVAIRAAVRGRIGVAGAALEVAALPLSLLVALSLVGLAFAAAGWIPATLALAAPASLVTYVAIGLAAARVRPRDLLAFTAAPRFFAYKLGVFVSLALRRGPMAWERTRRG